MGPIVPPLVPPYETVGDGPHHVMAVHGWFSDRAAYAAMLPHVDRRGFTYVLPDLRGYGEARDIPGAYTTGEVGKDLLALADHLGWERFSLVGHSMGGAVVQRVLAAAPQRVHAAGRGRAGVEPAECRWRASSGSCSRPPPTTRRTGGPSSTSPPADVTRTPGWT